MAPFQIRFGFNPAQQSNTQQEDDSEVEEEEYEDQEEFESEEEEEEEEDDEEVAISSPLICPASSEGSEEREESTNNTQFSVFEMVVTAVRKSLVMCSVGAEIDDVMVPAPRNSMDIGYPTDVRHVAHVTFDRFDGFLGLPVELEPELPGRVPSASVSVFGVSPNSMQCSFDKRGNSVPSILLAMQRHLYLHGGLQAEGIFRINAENGQEVEVREQLNGGVVPDTVDLHCLAGLIKAWFRELPSGVLDCLSPEQVMDCNTEEECFRLAATLPPAELALLDWSVNLMADVVESERFNKMNARNIAMVFAPNMTQMADPLTALIHAVQVMNFLKTLILKTIREREEELVTSGPNLSCSESPNHKDEPNNIKPVSIDNKNNDDTSCSSRRSQDFPVIDRTTFDQLVNVDNDAVKGFENGLINGNAERFSFRKGVGRLCRHPVFQLSRSMKKNGEIVVMDSGEGRQACV